MSALARALAPRPPSISSLIIAFDYTADYAWFNDIVAEVLDPEPAGLILSIPDPVERTVAFCEHITEHHFPIYPVTQELYYQLEEPIWSWLRVAIPFDPLGVEDETLHNVWENMGTGFATALLIAAPPEYHTVDPGIRIAWFEMARQRLRPETIELLPKDGIDLDILRTALSGTPFETVASLCAYAYNYTGNMFMDINYEDGMNYTYRWDREIVDAATEEWSSAREILQRIDKLTAWLEEDIHTRANEMTRFVIQRVSAYQKERRKHGRANRRRRKRRRRYDTLERA